MLGSRKVALAMLVGLASLAGTANADDWGRFYHYPYSYYPVNYRATYRSGDFNNQYGIPQHPQYMRSQPYYRRDL